MFRSFMISAVLVLSLQSGVPALGAPPLKKGAPDSNSTAAPAARPVHRGVASSANSMVKLGLGLGVASFAGSNGFGVNTAVAFRTKRSGSTWIGLDTGITVRGGAGTPIGLPIMVGVTFDRKDSDLRSYIGFSVGPFIGLSNETTGLGMFIKPGVTFPLDAVDITLEARFGGVNGNFFFYPQSNVVIPL